MASRRALAALAAIGCAAGAGSACSRAAPEPFTFEIVSSAPHQVSGGDARLHIGLPRGVAPEDVAVRVNGSDQAARFVLVPGTRTLSGVIDGLLPGANTVVAEQRSPGRRAPAAGALALVNHPVTGPIFSGPHQYPFVCTTMTEGLGQPLPDDPATGTRVLVDGETVGFSRDWSIEPRVEFLYRSTDTRLRSRERWKPWTPGMPRPADLARTTTLDGQTVDFIVRHERGTINRFIYSIAMLAPDDQGAQTLNRTAWNGRLIFRFDGGVGLGHSQGRPRPDGMLYEPGLAQGYAIAYSTGTRTSVHYNLQLGGETALMVKERFIVLYDRPVHTLAIGGSGGAVQQYLYAQNHPGLLDGGIAQYSYPDMVSQVVHVSDCELLEYHFDVTDAANPRWATWTERSRIQGLAASDTLYNPYNDDEPGMTECVKGWRGLMPLALNPHYGRAANQALFEPQSAIEHIEWTHFDDLVNVLGRAADGYARRYWDNVGVQYGLEALREGSLSVGEFLDLNASIGGWKASAEMVQEACPFYPVRACFDPDHWDPWSARNQVIGTPAAPAPRTAGAVEAMQALYRAGLVFSGDIGIPIIDWRHYLERELDMHHAHQSFAARQRILDARGEASNHLVWFTDSTDGARFDQTPEALAVLESWLTRIGQNPAAGVAGNRPPDATDRCFDAAGREIAAGAEVWRGVLDGGPPGACTQRFPLFRSSRQVAGGPFAQSLFKCQRIPVQEAIAEGFYGGIEFTAVERERLEAIFADGVCDFRQPDAGLPPAR